MPSLTLTLTLSLTLIPNPNPNSNPIPNSSTGSEAQSQMRLRWVLPQRRKGGAGAWAARLGAHLVRIRLRVTYATDSEFRTPCRYSIKAGPRGPYTRDVKKTVRTKNQDLRTLFTLTHTCMRCGLR